MKKIVMVFGTFDLFHEGHKFYISEASKLASQIIAIIARDNRVQKIKNIIPNHSENTRRENVENFIKKINSENIAILGNENDIFAPIINYNPDILCFGYDQNFPEKILREKFPNIELCKIWSYFPEKYKSSILRKNLKN